MLPVSVVLFSLDSFFTSQYHRALYQSDDSKTFRQLHQSATQCDVEREDFDTSNCVWKGQKSWMFSFIRRNEKWLGGLPFSKLCLSIIVDTPFSSLSSFLCLWLMKTIKVVFPIPGGKLSVSPNENRCSPHYKAFFYWWLPGTGKYFIPSCYISIGILNVDGKESLKIFPKCLPWVTEKVVALPTRMNDTKRWGWG